MSIKTQTYNLSMNNDYYKLMISKETHEIKALHIGICWSRFQLRDKGGWDFVQWTQDGEVKRVFDPLLSTVHRMRDRIEKRFKLKNNGYN